MPFDPAFTLTQLLSAETDNDQIVTFITTQLGQGTVTPGAGFPVTDWQPGGVALTLIQAFAAHVADSNVSISGIAAGGFIQLAAGNPVLAPGAQSSTLTWLDLLAFSSYGLTRQAPVTGQYTVTLTVAAGFGPYTIAPNGMWLVDSTGARRYNSINTSPVTISSAAPVVVTFQAESPGAAWNTNVVPPGSVLTLATPLLGVTAASSAAVSGGATSAVVAGADAELDASLRLRCTTQWATLSVVATFAAMINYAKSVVSTNGTVSAVFVQDTNPGGPGTCYIYIASGGTPAPGGLVTDVQTALNLKKPLTSTVTVFSAITTSPGADAVTLTGNCYIPAAVFAAVQAAITSAIATFQQGLGIGDGTGATVNPGAIYVSDLESLIKTAGAKFVDLVTPAADYVPAAGHIATILNSLTYVSV